MSIGNQFPTEKVSASPSDCEEAKCSLLARPRDRKRVNALPAFTKPCTCTVRIMRAGGIGGIARLTRIKSAPSHDSRPLEKSFIRPALSVQLTLCSVYRLLAFRLLYVHAAGSRPCYRDLFSPFFFSFSKTYLGSWRKPIARSHPRSRSTSEEIYRR